MFPIILAAALAAQPPPSDTLDAIFKAAAADLVFRVPPERRAYTRYLSFHGIPPGERGRFLAALHGAINGTHFRTRLYRLEPINDVLARLDLVTLGWDAVSREETIRVLEKQGVPLKFRDAEVRRLFVDVWEGLARLHPYFSADPHAAQVNPGFAEWVAHLSGSKSFVIAAHWLFPRLLIERQEGGFYSQLLLLPPREADLYKRLGVPAEFIDLEVSAKHGGAVTSSSVAHGPRELQLIPSSIGLDGAYLFRTFDFKRIDSREKDVRESLGGTAKHDGREILFSLPNGLQGGYLADGQGTQVSFVPQEIAEDQRPYTLDPDGKPTQSVVRTVANYIKCIDCHMEGGNASLISFQDQVLPLITARGTAYRVKSADYRAGIVEGERVAEYYGTPLGTRIDQIRATYARRIREATGLDPEAYRRAVIEYFDRYNAGLRPGLVTPEMAARELGLPLPVAVSLWKASGESQLGFLAAGQSVTRIRWEQTLGRTFAVPYTKGH